MTVSRPRIPPDMKKAVRRRCGYGCVICGFPFFHYDHIENFSNVQCHNEDNITLLCANHHDEKTRGVLPIDSVIEANKRPHALYYPDSLKQKLFFKSNEVTLKIASNELYTRPHDGAFIAPFVIYKRVPFYFDIEDGQLLLSGEFFDDLGRSVVKVDKNEIHFLRHDYDIERVGSRIIIRKTRNRIILDINTNPDEAFFEILTAIFMVHDVSVMLRKSDLVISDMRTDTKLATVKGCSNTGNIGFSIYSPSWPGSIGQHVKEIRGR